MADARTESWTVLHDATPRVGGYVVRVEAAEAGFRPLDRRLQTETKTPPRHQD